MKISNNIAAVANVIYSEIQWQNFFSDEEIERIITYCSSNELVDGGVSTAHGIGIDKSTRISKTNFHNFNDQTSWIFNRFNFGIEDINNKFVHFDLYGYDAFQYSEYHAEESGKYDFHMDMFMNNDCYQNKLTRKLSLVLLLSEPGVDFEGGEFQMTESSETKLKTIAMKKGTLVTFPSFMIHRVTPVTKGIRSSIVIWVEGPKFK